MLHLSRPMNCTWVCPCTSVALKPLWYIYVYKYIYIYICIYIIYIYIYIYNARHDLLRFEHYVFLLSFYWGHIHCYLISFFHTHSHTHTCTNTHTHTHMHIHTLLLISLWLCLFKSFNLSFWMYVLMT